MLQKFLWDTKDANCVAELLTGMRGLHQGNFGSSATGIIQWGELDFIFS